MTETYNLLESCLSFFTEIVYTEPVADVTAAASPEQEYNSLQFSFSGMTVSEVCDFIVL